MAFTGEDVANFDLALKTYYVQTVVRDISDKVPFLKTIDGKDERPCGGRSRTATWEVETAANLGWGVLSTDGSDFATPRKGTYKNYSLSIADLDVGFEISGNLETAGVQKDMNFFMQLGEKFANETKKTMTRLLGILVMLDGTANIGTILSIATNTITMDTGNINNILLTMRLTIRDTAASGSEQLTSAQPASGTVTNVDEYNNAFTVTDATGAAAGDVIAIYEFYGTTLPNGIRNMISNTGTFQGIVRTTAGNTFAQSPVVTNTGVYGDSMLIAACHNVLKYSRDDDPSADWLAITHHNDTLWYYLTKQDQVRFTQDSKKIVGGYDGVGLSTGGGGTVYLTADVRAMPGETVILRPQDFGILRPTSGVTSGWVENAGSYLFQKTGSAAGGVYADAKQGWWIDRRNYYCDRPRNSLRLNGYRSITA